MPARANGMRKIANAARYAASDAAKDSILTKMADIGLEVLIELKSPGCQWLDVCD